MPRGRSAKAPFTSNALDTIRQLRQQIESTKRTLRLERAVCLSKIADIDQALAELGETPPANATETVIDNRAPKGDRDKRIVEELRELEPWAGGLSEPRRNVFDMRARGMSPQEIAAKTGSTRARVTVMICQARTQLRELKTRAAPPATKPASDGEEEGEPAPAAQIDPQGTPVALEEIQALTAPAARAAPGLPAHILSALDAEQWECFQALEIEGAHPDTHAWLTGRSPQQVRGLGRAAREKIDRLMAQEADGDAPSEQQLAPTKRPERDRLLDALGIPPPAPRARETLEARAANDVDPIVAAGVGRGRGPRHCRRCGQEGHRIDGCDLTDEDLGAARIQDIAAACVRLGLATPPKPRAPLPAKAEPLAPAVLAPTWTREDLEGWEEEFGPIEEIAPALAPAPAIEQIAIVPPPEATDAAIESLFDRTPPARARAKLRIVDGESRVRGKTIAPRPLSRDERAIGEMLGARTDVERPIERGDCLEDSGRPCPWVSCSHHLFLDVNPKTGAIKLNFPHLEVWEMTETCSLDAADRGGITLQEVGAILNLTRERIRQVEVRGMDKIKRANPDGIELPDDRRGSPLAEAIGD